MVAGGGRNAAQSDGTVAKVARCLRGGKVTDELPKEEPSRVKAGP